MLRLGIQSCMRSLLSTNSKVLVLKVATNNNSLLLTSQSVRHTSFFNRLTAEELWKGVTTVSNAGKKRGRGRGGDRRGKKNLNFGQRVGQGKIPVTFPGLNCPLFGDSSINTIKQLEVPETPAETVPKQRTLGRKKMFFSPLERGWSGGRRAGRKLGPPDPAEEYEGFESIILELKLKSMLTSILGRKKFFSVMVATGNKNGMVGIGKAVGGDANACLRLAKNRAAKKLVHIDLIHRDSVMHDFFSEYGRTRIFVQKRSPGYGLICHRAIKALCELIGIKNIHAKIEGPINLKHVIRAFIVGLLRQKTFQEIADETKLHLVEFQKERFHYPEVLASPSECLSLKEARKQNINLQEFLLGGLLYRKPKQLPFYTKLRSYKTHLKRTLFRRNHEQLKLNLLVDYGRFASHLVKKYPECCNRRKPKSLAAKENAA